MVLLQGTRWRFVSVFFHLWLPDWLSFMKGRHTEVIEGLQSADDEWIVKERDGLLNSRLKELQPIIYIYIYIYTWAGILSVDNVRPHPY